VRSLPSPSSPPIHVQLWSLSLLTQPEQLGLGYCDQLHGQIPKHGTRPTSLNPSKLTRPIYLFNIGDESNTTLIPICLSVFEKRLNLYTPGQFWQEHTHYYLLHTQTIKVSNHSDTDTSRSTISLSFTTSTQFIPKETPGLNQNYQRITSHTHTSQKNINIPNTPFKRNA